MLLSGLAGLVYFRSTVICQFLIFHLLGAMAERTSLNAYVVFSFLNTIVYCIPAHWVWGSTGFLYKLGCIDIAGSGAVHLLGAASAMVCTYYVTH